MTQIDDVLTFWFGELPSDHPDYNTSQKRWFAKDAAFDQTIRDRFLSTYEHAVANQLDYWLTTPLGTLALVLVCDQFSRNLFRGSPQAFASDAKALAIAKAAIARHVDQVLAPIQRVFLYLPLEHSEDWADQHQCVALFQQLVAEQPHLHEFYDYAVRHCQVIEQFGRFPHRNRMLGRETTAAEAEFLKQPGSSF